MKFTTPLALAAMALLVGLPQRGAAAGVQPSQWVYPSYLGDLLYGSDTNGVRINDFSNCGYQRGEVALPEMRHFVPESEWIRLSPLSNGRDNSTLINGALQAVGVRPTNAHGFRGVVYLEPGEFRLDSTIWMTNSGVVLKGAGSSYTTGTRLRATFARPDNMIHMTNIYSSLDNVLGAEAVLSEWLVPAGTRTFRVDNPALFKVGEHVWVRHWASWSWIRALDMHKLNGPWIGVDRETGDYERQITRIEGDWITVDSPLPQTFELRYGNGTMQRVVSDERVGNCGIEDLVCIFASNPGDDDKAHPAAAVSLVDAVNVWVRNVTAVGYFTSCVTVEGRSKFITVAESQMYHPTNSAHHDRYSFRIAHRASHVLMRDCQTEHSRHDYMTESTVPGPNAFVRCTTRYSDDDTGPHQRWATGLLFDQIFVNDSGDRAKTSGQLNIQNRGNSGSGDSHHGWAGAYSVVWNCYASEGFRVRNPPTALNWLIGSDGETHESMRGCWWSPFWFGDGDCWAVGADPAGTYDQSGEDKDPVQLRSLYYAQLQQRFKAPRSEFREYRLGVIDQFRYSGLWDEGLAFVDPDWLQSVRGFSGAPDGATNRFDVLHTNLYTAFTFNFPTAPGEQIIAGSITLGLRLVPGADQHRIKPRLYLTSSDFSEPFSVLGWNVTSNASSVHTVEVEPWHLQYGKLNVGIGPNCGVDFAVLNLQVTPAIASTSLTELPTDSYVRDGSYANQNFNGDPELILKEDNSSGFSRRAFMDWNLAEVKGKPIEARVRLYCNYSGQTGNEQSASLVREKNWHPNSVTWNTQPTIPPAFAYWTPEPGTFVEFIATPEVNAVLGAPVITDRHFAIGLKSAQDFGDHGDVAYASREDPDPARRPQLILRFANSPPTIVPPANTTMDVHSTLGPLAVTIGDSETPPGNLTLTASSSSVAISAIALGGAGPDRTVTLQSGSRVGSAKITLTVSDGGQTASASFIVNVRMSNNTAPSISLINSLTTDEDIPALVNFTVIDTHSPPGDLTVAVSTSNNQLFPAGSIQPTNGLGGGSGSHAYLFSPALDSFGTALINVAVSDGFLVTTQSFTLLVRSIADPPAAVRMETPPGGDNLLPNVPALLRASAFDAETNMALIRYYRQHPANRIDQLVGTGTNAMFSAIWTNPPPGDCHLYAVAIDGTGLAATSPPVAITISVPEVVPPRLVIGQLSNSVVVLWPDSLGSNSLKTTTNLSAPILWSPLPSGPSLGEGAWIYEIPMTEPRRFFRLD